MASIRCRNGSLHTHSSVTESKVCWGLIARPTPQPVYAPVILVPLATGAQLDFVDVLKGDRKYASNLSKKDCSTYISDLKSGKIKPMTTTPAAPAVPSDDEFSRASTRKTTKTDMILGLISMVPDGYFAVQREEGEVTRFMRVKRVTSGKMKGCLKVQTQHGPRLENAWAVWPDGHVSILKYDIEDSILLLIADYQGAMKRYAEELQHCMRCNFDLTDPRSRHYGVGPECETKMGMLWVVEQADEKWGAPWELLPDEIKFRAEITRSKGR